MWQTLVKLLRNPTVHGVLVTLAVLLVEALKDKPETDSAQKR